MVDPPRRLRGDVHAPARRDHRRRSASGDTDRPSRHVRRCAMGRRRLRPHPGLPALDDRRPRRSVRSAPVVRHRARHLHPRLADLRLGPVCADADHLPERAGHRGRNRVRHLARPLGPELPRQGPRGCLRDLGSHHRRGGLARADPRRRHHHRDQLAGHLPRQRPRRCRGHRRDALEGGGVPVPASRSTGLGRIRAPHQRPRRPRLRVDQGERDVLVQQRGHHLPGHWSRARWPPSSPSSSGSTTPCSTCPCSAPRLSSAVSSRPSR